MSDTAESITPRTWTVTLEDQGRAPDERITLGSSFRKSSSSGLHNRCQHEARSKKGIIRQCRNRAVTVINGQRLCYRHTHSPD